MTIRNLFAAMAAFACLCAAAQAETEAEAKLRLAKEFIGLMQAEQLVEQMTAQMGPMQAQIIKSSNPNSKLTDAEIDAIVGATTAIVAEEMRPAIAAFVEKVAPVYAGVYTREELQGLVDFYRSPVGAAFLEKQPLLVERSMAVSTQWAQESLPAVMARAKPRIEARVRELQKKR